MQTQIQYIASLPMFSQHAKIDAVPAGIVNDAYKVTENDQTFMVKFLPHKDVGQTPRTDIFAMQKELAKRDLAVEPVYYDDTQDIWVEHWCVHPVFSASDVVDEDGIMQLAKVSSTLHNLKLDAPQIDIVGAWRRYLDKVPQARRAELSVQVDAFEAKMRRYATQHLALCHHDLSIGHLTRPPHTVIFDWEYAGVNNRYFDLASTILINQMNGQCAEQFIQHYAAYHGDDVSDVRNQIALLEPCVSLTYLLWMMAEPHRA
ncbi:phosphotransferase [Aestuariibacter salexigens]|uniref:phosphotransferase n=1 Tax=Aestuariibacter salexigens TaxID=226010 RepID=UPI00041E44A4|nr:phosphotransferase [Aestuariibacter salexigens]